MNIKYYDLCFRPYSGHVGIEVDSFVNHPGSERNGSNPEYYVTLLHFDRQDGEWLIYNFKNFSVHKNTTTGRVQIKNLKHKFGHKIKKYILTKIFSKLLDLNFERRP